MGGGEGDVGGVGWGLSRPSRTPCDGSGRGATGRGGTSRDSTRRVFRYSDNLLGLITRIRVLLLTFHGNKEKRYFYFQLYASNP